MSRRPARAEDLNKAGALLASAEAERLKVHARRQRDAAPACGRHRRPLRASVAEADYSHIVNGQTAKISADTFGERTFPGHVDLVETPPEAKSSSTPVNPRERMAVRVIEVLVTPAPLDPQAQPARAGRV